MAEGVVVCVGDRTRIQGGQAVGHCRFFDGILRRCGFLLGSATHTSWLYGFAFLPWMAWRLDCGLQTHNYWYSGQAGSLYGIAVSFNQTCNSCARIPTLTERWPSG